MRDRGSLISEFKFSLLYKEFHGRLQSYTEKLFPEQTKQEKKKISVTEGENLREEKLLATLELLGILSYHEMSLKHNQN